MLITLVASDAIRENARRISNGFRVFVRHVGRSVLEECTTHTDSILSSRQDDAILPRVGSFILRGSDGKTLAFRLRSEYGKKKSPNVDVAVRHVS